MKDCAHHYVIPASTGRYAWGECKKCGHRRKFTNSAPTSFDYVDGAQNIFQKKGENDLQWRLKIAEDLMRE